MRILARAAVITTVICLAVQVFAPAARAETAYRYWTFWTVANSEWVLSQVGPASTVPADGDVQAWRFPTLAFERICGTVTKPTGQIRVAMVIDPGLTNTAPDGQSPPPARGACAVIAESRSGADALMAIATPRVDKGLVCGIDEYPVGECAIAIDINTSAISPDSEADVLIVPTPAVSEIAIAAAPVTEKGSPIPLIAVGLIIALGLVGAWLLQRRRAS